MTIHSERVVLHISSLIFNGRCLQPRLRSSKCIQVGTGQSLGAQVVITDIVMVAMKLPITGAKFQHLAILASDSPGQWGSDAPRVQKLYPDKLTKWKTNEFGICFSTSN